MINYGRQTLVQSVVTPYNTSPDLEYVQIMNESPYILTCTFRGMGFMDIPAWHKEDVLMGSGYNGQLDILPQNITTGQASAQSSVVSVNGFAPGEIQAPQSVALARMSNPSVDIFAELYAFVEWTSTVQQTVTLPNVAGKTVFLDNFDITLIAGASNDVLTVTVNAITSGMDYSYFGTSSTTAPGNEDHVPFGINRGVQQAPNTDITIKAKNTVATNITNLNVHYHYERNF